jgi:hypothetical protein
MDLALSTTGSVRGDGSVYGGSQYGGSVRGRPGTASSARPTTASSARPGTASTARPQSSYMGGSAGSEFGFSGASHAGSVRAESRARSKSLAEPKNYNSQGRLILNYCKFVPSLSYIHTYTHTHIISFANDDDSARNVLVCSTDPRGIGFPKGRYSCCSALAG